MSVFFFFQRYPVLFKFSRHLKGFHDVQDVGKESAANMVIPVPLVVVGVVDGRFLKFLNTPA